MAIMITAEEFETLKDDPNNEIHLFNCRNDDSRALVRMQSLTTRKTARGYRVVSSPQIVWGQQWHVMICVPPLAKK